MAKTVLSAISQAWKYKKFLKSDNIDDVLFAVNTVVSIYIDHQTEIKAKEEAKDFSNVEGVDFNIWAYVQEIGIQNLYFDFYDLHFDKYQFNAY